MPSPRVSLQEREAADSLHGRSWRAGRAETMRIENDPSRPMFDRRARVPWSHCRRGLHGRKRHWISTHAAEWVERVGRALRWARWSLVVTLDRGTLPRRGVFTLDDVLWMHLASGMQRVDGLRRWSQRCAAQSPAGRVLLYVGRLAAGQSDLCLVHTPGPFQRFL